MPVIGHLALLGTLLASVPGAAAAEALAPGDVLAPASILVKSTAGEARVPVRVDPSGAPVVPASPLILALRGSLRVNDGWAEVVIARQPFRFLVGTPLFVFSNQLRPLAAQVTVIRDTLYLPFQFVAEIIPYFLSERYQYDERTARLIELAGGDARSTIASGGGTTSSGASIPDGAGVLGGASVPARDKPRLPSGLRSGHVVTIDPGHGGVDPGTAGVFLPRGIREKDITLQVGLMLREELRRRGVQVRMTRTTDTLIALGDRGGYCTDACDLFVSLHVNALPRRPGYTAMRGFETYFLAEAKTADAARVAKMENEAVRFETGSSATETGGGLDFILKDLQLNEHLRESAQVAHLVQQNLRKVHTGENRGVKQAGFMVLTTARRPAILVEMGYSTNPDDSRFLTTRSSQRSMASAIADAVVEYLLDYERKTGVGDGSRASR